MKRILLVILSVLVVSSASAQVRTLELMKSGMPAALAKIVGPAIGDSLLCPSTADGADSVIYNICGGGAASSSRGSCITLNGNESANNGDLTLSSGGQTGSSVYVNIGGSSGSFDVKNSSATTMWSFNGSTGNLNGNASGGGDIALLKSGTTLSIQEATGSSACMGAATPNGTTPVTVTTSCAVSGARVFFSRAGAVTNMASISVTTAPNGTSFQFASTGASDTLASSVIYLIVKESA